MCYQKQGWVWSITCVISEECCERVCWSSSTGYGNHVPHSSKQAGVLSASLSGDLPTWQWVHSYSPLLVFPTPLQWCSGKDPYRLIRSLNIEIASNLLIRFSQRKLMKWRWLSTLVPPSHPLILAPPSRPHHSPTLYPLTGHHSSVHGQCWSCHWSSKVGHSWRAHQLAKLSAPVQLGGWHRAARAEHDTALVWNTGRAVVEATSTGQTGLTGISYILLY